jgi:hypothetical protein
MQLMRFKLTKMFVKYLSIYAVTKRERSGITEYSKEKLTVKAIFNCVINIFLKIPRIEVAYIYIIRFYSDYNHNIEATINYSIQLS